MPITVAVCDDEKNIREHIKHLIAGQCADCRVDVYPTGDSLLKAQTEYDIYFLDIQMPGTGGMETAGEIRARHKNSGSAGIVIFITAFSEYMADAFDVQAFHYLVKPLDEGKFAAVFARAMGELTKKLEYILIKNGAAHQKIYTKDIFYIESRNNKVVVTGTDGINEYYATLRALEGALGAAFFRCHRCYLVNMAHIKRYNACTIRLANGDDILLARKKYPFFTKAYMAFLRN